MQVINKFDAIAINKFDAIAINKFDANAKSNEKIKHNT